jgi:hypothetical protein
MTLLRIALLALVCSAALSAADPVPPPAPVPGFTPKVDVDVAKGEIQILALVDGIVELHVTATGIHWVNGMYAKPGQHGRQNVPTYVNGTPWFPKWGQPEKNRGLDRSEPFPLPVPSLNLALELIAVGEKPDATEIEPRSPITLQRAGDAVIVTIPDPEWGSRWYHFALVPAGGE